MSNKIYKCFRCGKVLEKEKPIRFVKQMYGIAKYKQYAPLEHYDFCSDCYRLIQDKLDQMRDRRKANE